MVMFANPYYAYKDICCIQDSLPLRAYRGTAHPGSLARINQHTIDTLEIHMHLYALLYCFHGLPTWVSERPAISTAIPV